MQYKITKAIDALILAAVIEGGVSDEKLPASRELTNLRKSELMEAISAPCLHQIQEPAPVPAVPAAVAVPDALIADARRLAYVADQVRALEPKGSESDVYLTEAAHVFRACADRITALAATPAAAPVVLPEPVTWLIERSAFHVSPHGQDAESNEWLEEAHEPGEEGSFPVYTEQQVRALHGFTAFNQWLNYRLTPQPGAFLILGD